MSLDDRVNAWLLDRWVSGSREMHPTYKRWMHGKPERIEVISSDAGWDCGCYSEFTRDDRETLYATFRTAKGDIEVEYGSWGDLPRHLEELVDYGESDCVYDEEDE